jgi:hypothetical protein
MSNDRDIHHSCKKAKAFAWAKFYEALARRADDAIIIVRQIPMTNNQGTVTVDASPAHFSTEFVEMAKARRRHSERSSAVPFALRWSMVRP